MSSPQRLRRIADEIQRELSELLRSELKDPRVGMVTFTAVEVSPDIAHATVYFTVLGGGDAVAHSEEGLRRAAGFLRSRLAQRLRLRSVPDLRFRFDASVERGAQLARLIDAAVGGPKHD